MVISASQGRSLKLFLVNGSSDSVVIAGLGGSTTVILFAPRTALADLLSRAESRRTGVYLLVGSDPNNVARSLVYVGEGDDVAARLVAHDKDGAKDFFERVCLVVSRDDEFHKAHSRYLEGRLIAAIRKAGRATLMNATEPPAKGLNEADLADMSGVLGEVELILPTLGLDVLTSAPIQGLDHEQDETRWVYTGGDCRARAREAGASFVVLSGSLARSYEVESASEAIRATRRQLLDDGSVQPTADGRMWKFTRDVPFPSPSAAVSAVYGGSVSGPQYRRDEKSGQTYGDWRQKQLAAAAAKEIDDLLG